MDPAESSQRSFSHTEDVSNWREQGEALVRDDGHGRRQAVDSRRYMVAQGLLSSRHLDLRHQFQLEDERVDPSLFPTPLVPHVPLGDPKRPGRGGNK
eukprot:scaffold125424_cov30-Tisochrysis_lutea.AAC.1